MPRQILLTLDVEALPGRAAKDHIDRLIFGKFGKEAYGIDKIFDIASTNNIQLTCFFDYGALPRYGEQWLDIARHIHARGMDLQLHLHPDFYGKDFWQNLGIEPCVDLLRATKEQADALIGNIVETHARAVGNKASAFRGGAYRFNGHLLSALAANGVKYDSTYNPGRGKQLFNIGNLTPFQWDCGITELPIPFLTNLYGYPKALEFNFNNYYFQAFAVEKCIDNILSFLDLYFNKFPAALPVMVMHSWSFLNLNKVSGRYESINHKSGEIFAQLCVELNKRYSIVSCADLEKQNFTGTFIEKYRVTRRAPVELNSGKTGKCNICGASGADIVTCTYNVKRYCKKCRSLERQRMLAKLLDSQYFPIQLNQKDVLHLSGSYCERQILGKFDGINVKYLDINPDANVDIIADICHMPQVPDQSFDMILCCQVLPHVYDIQAAIAELSRILRDGGIIIQHNFSDPERATQEITDPDKITAYYGADKYEKYRVGSFRNFGEVGLDDIFSPWLERERIEITDDVTGAKGFWNIWRKRTPMPVPCVKKPVNYRIASGLMSLFSGIKNNYFNK